MKKTKLETDRFRQIVLRMRQEVVDAVAASQDFSGEEEFRDLVITATTYCGQSLVELAKVLNVHVGTIARWKEEHLPPVGYRHEIAVKIADVIRKHNV